MSQKRILFHSNVMKKAKKSSSGFILPVLFILIALAILGGLYGLVVWKWSYSDGERDRKSVV